MTAPDTSAIAPAETAPSALAPAGAFDITRAMQLAIDKGPDGVLALERLVAMQERLLDRQAEADIGAALQAFQRECPQIVKNKKVEVAMRGGGDYSFKQATLDSIDRTIAPFLERHGLSRSWTTRFDDKGRLVVTCTAYHRGGGKRSAEFPCPPTGSPTMSDAQKIESAQTIGMRQTLIALFGLTLLTDDAPPEQPGAAVSDEQRRELERRVDSLKVDVGAFLRAFRADSFDAIRAADYPRAIEMLNRKAAQR